jgi:CspA family cold shock protein
MQRDVRIHGETISRGRLLEVGELIRDSREVKRFLANESVCVNGKRETRRGRKLRLDDVVQIGELELRLTSADFDIRRPELRGARRLGIVRWYDDHKGYGRITAEDGEVLFVHFSGVVGDGYRSLQQGRRVSFVWNGGIQDHGRHLAEDVRVAT